MGCRGLPGCSIIRASLTVALMVSLPSQISAFCALAARSPCICSRLRVALPPLAATAHRADASLRCAAGRFGPLAQVPTGHTLPFAPCRGLGQTPGRSIVAEGAVRAHRSFRSLANIGVLRAVRAHRSFRSLANIGVLRAVRAQPLYLLTPSGRFAAFGGNSPPG